jgi:hypothetical protein
MFSAARSGDKFDLKKVVEFQNTMFIAGVQDSSLTSSNWADVNEELNCTPQKAKHSAGYFERENGDVGVGVTFIDEFRAGAKLADILFFADQVKLKVSLNQRLYTFIKDADVNGFVTGATDLFRKFALTFQYRSYLDMSMTFGNDLVKYTLNPYIQARCIFTTAAGVDSVRVYSYLGHKIAITKIMDIQASTEYMVRWYNETKPCDGTLSLDFRIGAPGLAGGGSWYLTAFEKRANGYDLGPVSLSWFIRASLDLDMNLAYWKDTDVGNGKLTNTTSTAYAYAGVMKAYRFRLRQAEIWVDVLKTNPIIGLNIGATEFLDIQGNWSHNWALTTTVRNDAKVGAELVLDKAFVIGAFARIRTQDFFNANGIALNGKLGQTSQKIYSNATATTKKDLSWVNQSTDVATVYYKTKSGKIYAYQTIPMGNGQIGPQIYVGVVKDAFEWMFCYQGFANFRTYDLKKTYATAGSAKTAQSYMKRMYAADSESYYNWRNEIETWVTWKW